MSSLFRLQTLNPSSDNVLRRDLRFSGFVTWTGKSSMEVVVKMEGSSADSTSCDTLMIGRFAMVCRDNKTHEAKKVPDLIVESEEERALWDIGAGEHRSAYCNGSGYLTRG